MSIQRRPKTGKDKNGRVRWVARYRDTAGKEHARTFATKTDAKAWETEQLRALRSGTWIDPADQQITVYTLVRDYRDTAARPSTREARDYLLRCLGDMGAVPVGQLRPAMVTRWVRDLQHKPLSANTIANRLSMLRGALNGAVDQRMIPTNPAAKVRGPSMEMKVDVDVLPTPQQAAGLIRAWMDGDKAMGVSRREDIALVMSLAVHCGHRLGEALGVRPCDLNVVAGTVRVARQKGGAELKTRSSRRVVSADPALIEHLLDYAARRGVGDSAEVFGHLSSRVLSYSMNRSQAVGLVPPGCTFHTLRHFHATQLLSAGMSVKAVSARLGHANAAMTLNVYAHALQADDVRAAEIMAGLMRANCGMEGEGRGGLRAV
ncbi:site-specific integrase [Corynebacterium sp. P6145]|uniref:tyrosine-type recombinase/integrase n=1 Tax=Corynebacterium antarcticum TaxID=2800405 RepID=UPI002005165F|nr:site-specific integrase [Corynebacterium antarcticum]